MRKGVWREGESPWGAWATERSINFSTPQIYFVALRGPRQAILLSKHECFKKIGKIYSAHTLIDSPRFLSYSHTIKIC